MLQGQKLAFLVKTRNSLNLENKNRRGTFIHHIENLRCFPELAIFGTLEVVFVKQKFTVL